MHEAANDDAPPSLRPGDPDVPVLGQPGAGNQRGYGEVQPKTIHNGGSGSGRVERIVWESWGEETATGHGVAHYVPPNARSGLEGKQARATVVAYRLGRCNGRLMYKALTWFFPEEGEEFEPSPAMDMCEHPN
jgi:hypothetical protein